MLERLTSRIGLASRFARNAGRAFTHREAHRVVSQINGQMDWLLANRIPPCYPRELLPGIGRQKVSVDVDVGHPFELPPGERTILAAVLCALNAKVVFEIGTYTGTTTRIMADAIPSGVVHSLDLPPGKNVFDADISEQVGTAFRNDPLYATRIIQHFGDSRTFDFSPWRGRADLVFVDGSHERDDVLSDSQRALDMLSPGGVIVWDDYQPTIPGVVAALHELGRTMPLVHVVGTRLVIYRDKRHAIASV